MASVRIFGAGTLSLGEPLGAGTYGEVYAASAMGPEALLSDVGPLAVKLTLHGTS